MDFVEICNVCAGKAIIEAAGRIINSDKVCRSYSDLNFGVTFLEHSVYSHTSRRPISCRRTQLDLVTKFCSYKYTAFDSYCALQTVKKKIEL